MLVKKLQEFLDARNIRYDIIGHSPANTAQRTAASAHIHGKDMAKTVMIKADGTMTMAVLPANYRIDLAQLRESIGARSVSLAAEDEFRSLFPDCENGAMPPFGNLYGMPVLVEETLTTDESIAFNAGTHTELVKMHYKDFEALVKPEIKKFSVKLL
jgi:Ala-tRNA(Pro) deacylase